MRIYVILFFAAFFLTPLHGHAKSHDPSQSLPQIRAEFSLFSMGLDQEQASADLDSPIGATNSAYRRDHAQEIITQLQMLQNNPVLAQYPGMAQAITEDLSQLQSNNAQPDQRASTPVTSIAKYVDQFIKQRCHVDYGKKDLSLVSQVIHTAERGNYAGLFCEQKKRGYSNCQITTKDKCTFYASYKKNKAGFVHVLDRS